MCWFLWSPTMLSIYDFFRNIFGFADTNTRKRKAPGENTCRESDSPKKCRLDNHSSRLSLDSFTNDDSDSEPEILMERTNFRRATRPSTVGISTRGSHRCEAPKRNGAVFAPCPSTFARGRSRRSLGEPLARKYPTMETTHDLQGKLVYEELLQNFIAKNSTSVGNGTLHNRQNPPREDVIVLDDTEPPPGSSKSQESTDIAILSSFGPSKRNDLACRKIARELGKFGAISRPVVAPRSASVSRLPSKESVSSRIAKDSNPSKESSKENLIPSVPSNSLRDELASKDVLRDNFVQRTMKKFDDRLEECFKRVEDLQARKLILARQNRMKREVALEEQWNRSLKLCEAVLDEREVPEEPTLPTLTPEMLQEVKNALVPRPAEQVLVQAFGLNIKRQDINTLANLNWLNDEVINFYMNLLIARGEGGGEKYPRVYAMNTFFYPKLIASGHSSLKRWTRKVDIFAQDIVVVPVHLGIHWCMSIIDFRSKCIRYFDSMGGNNQKCLLALRRYLEDESMDKKKKPYDTGDWKLICEKDIPQQMNGSDCGVFSCMFAEYVCANRKITFTQQDMPYFRNKMVYEILKAKLL